MLALGMVLVAGIQACVPVDSVRSPSLPPLDDEVARYVSGNRAVVWAANRPLAWADFEAAPPPSAGQQGAVTGYSLFHGVRCTGQRFQFRVVTAFLPGQSWVRPIVLADPTTSASSLRHEQTHFDLAEVAARRMRRHFSELDNPCGQSQEKLGAIAAAFVGDDIAAQARYDDETRHGLNGARQQQWDADTAAMLASSEKFDGR